MKYEFASPGWMAFMHGMLTARMEALGEAARDMNWSICEVFTDPPGSLSPDGSPLAWHCVIRDGAVEFGDTDRGDVDFRVVVDYAAVLPLGRYDAAGDPERAAELAGMGQALVAKGLMKTQGDRSRRDPRIGNLHDPIARVTA